MTPSKIKRYAVTIKFTWPALILAGLLALAGAYLVVAWIALAALNV